MDERAVIEALRRFDDLWEALFPAEQARIVRLLVDRVTVGPQAWQSTFATMASPRSSGDLTCQQPTMEAAE